jgi:SPP1 gp7 family putative phage head morphogenesis protein
VAPSRSKEAKSVDALVRESVARVDVISPEAMRALLPVLRDVRQELRQDLSEWLARANGADRFTPFEKRKALRAIEGALERIKDLQPAAARALGLGRAAAGPLAVKNLDREIVRLGQIFGETMRPPQIDIAAIIANGDKLLWRQHERSAARYAGQIGEDLRHQLALGLAKGETIAQMTARMSTLGGGRPSPMDAEAISHAMGMRWQYVADRLVRTETMRAYNVDHQAALIDINTKRPEGEDEWMRRWSAAADRGTCPICSDLDDRVAPLDGTFKGGWDNPPIHPHCRCVIVAWLKRWGDVAGERPARDDNDNVPRSDRELRPSGEERTVRARDLMGTGRVRQLPGLETGARMDRARRDIAAGQPYAIKINVSPGGVLDVEDGRHRLAAAVEGDKQIRVHFRRGSAGLAATVTQ